MIFMIYGDKVWFFSVSIIIQYMTSSDQINLKWIHNKILLAIPM